MFLDNSIHEYHSSNNNENIIIEIKIILSISVHKLSSHHKILNISLNYISLEEYVLLRIMKFENGTLVCKNRMPTAQVPTPTIIVYIWSPLQGHSI